MESNSLQKIDISYSAAQKPVQHSDRQQIGGKCLLCKQRVPLNYLLLLHNQWGHLYSPPRHLFKPFLVTPECLLSETSLLVWPRVCFLRNASLLLPVVARPCSSPPPAWSRNVREHWDGSLCSSDLQKVEREVLPSAESEQRMTDGSKQSNSVALLYEKRTNICQGWMMRAASAPIIQCARFSHVAFLVL